MSCPERLTDEQLAAKLLRDEYPDQMAAASCTCTADVTCGAHRLLTQYEALWQKLREAHLTRREANARNEAWRTLVNGGPCPTCDGRPTRRPTNIIDPADIDRYGRVEAWRCPDCTDGRAPGLIERLEAITAGLIPNKGWWANDLIANDLLAAVIAELHKAVEQ